MSRPGLTRADRIRALAMCEALAGVLRDGLKAEAAKDAEAGTLDTWRAAGITVSASEYHPCVVVVDELQFLRYVQAVHPSEVEQRPRPAWLTEFLKKLAAQGGPPVDREGTVIPGLEYRPGGGFKTISVQYSGDTKQVLQEVASAVVAGTMPLALPGLNVPSSDDGGTQPVVEVDGDEC